VPYQLPELHRPRLAQLRTSARPAMVAAGKACGTAAPAVLVVWMYFGRWRALGHTALALLLGAAFEWAQILGDQAVHIVMTERYSFARSAPGRPLEDMLDRAFSDLVGPMAKPPSPLVELLAFQNCCYLAERGGALGKSWLKSVAIGREGASEWGRLADLCLLTLQGLTQSLKTCLEHAANGEAQGSKTVGFNRRSSEPAARPRAGSRRPRSWEVANALIREKYQLMGWSARTLSALCEAGSVNHSPVITESEPSLATVISEIACCLNALQEYLRSWGTMSVSNPAFRDLAQKLRARLQDPEGADAPGDVSGNAWALEDTLKLAVYCIVQVAAAEMAPEQRGILAASLEQAARDASYGKLPPVFCDVLKRNPSYGTRDSLASVLAACLRDEL